MPTVCLYDVIRLAVAYTTTSIGINCGSGAAPAVSRRARQQLAQGRRRLGRTSLKPHLPDVRGRPPVADRARPGRTDHWQPETGRPSLAQPSRSGRAVAWTHGRPALLPRAADCLRKRLVRHADSGARRRRVVCRRASIPLASRAAAGGAAAPCGMLKGGTLRISSASRCIAVCVSLCVCARARVREGLPGPGPHSGCLSPPESLTPPGRAPPRAELLRGHIRPLVMSPPIGSTFEDPEAALKKKS